MDYDVTLESVDHDPFYSLQNLAATKSLYCMMDYVAVKSIDIGKFVTAL